VSAVRRSLAALIVGFALCEAGGARAGEIDISPVTVTLTPPARVAQITIRNPTDQPLRFQISAFTWIGDASDGSVKMTPTQDVVVFPQLVTIPLFGKQEIRAAIISPPGAVEKTYRILLDVLPPLSSAEQLGPGVHLSIRTRFTVPIFQEPLAVRMSGQITTAAAKRGTVQFTILNSGNTHLGGDEIRIIGRNDGGRVIFSEAFRGWYVLIDSKRTFSSHLPQNACGDVRSVTIAPPPDMNVLPKKIEVASGVCGA
jgi:fimbrial chaperone protein